MARPPIIQKLKHGRLLCGNVFRFFVETWNWLTSYVDNMKGDLDVDPKNGVITVDRAQADHPVIRLRKDRLRGLVGVPADGPFSPVYDEDGDDPEVVTGFENCYWMNGGVTIHMEDQDDIPGTDGFIALKAGATPDASGDASLECYADIEALNNAQRDIAFFIVPLYIFEESKIVLDLRRIPHVYTAEVLP